MADSGKEKLVSKILNSQLGDCVSWQLKGAPPLLGGEYADSIYRVRQRFQKHISGQRFILEAQDIEDLVRSYDLRGATQDDELIKHWREVRDRAPFGKYSSDFLLAGLGKPDLVADYGYWGRMEWFELSEVLWLSVGLDPRKNWEPKLDRQQMGKVKNQAIKEYVDGQRDQLSRFASRIDPIPKKFKGPELLSWIEDSGFPTHPKFIDMLHRVRSRAEVVSRPLEQAAVVHSKTDKREIDKIAQLFTAMAIDQLGYDPIASRGPIPKEIADLAAKMDLDVSVDTVRKYLRTGANFIPDGWKPD